MRIEESSHSTASWWKESESHVGLQHQPLPTCILLSVTIHQQEEERIAREAKEADEKTAMSKKPGKSHGFVTFPISLKLLLIFPFRLRTVAGETRVVAKMWD